MNTTLNQGLITELAQAVLEGTPEEVMEIKALINMLPCGEQIHEAVKEEMESIITNTLINNLKDLVEGEPEEEKEEEDAVKNLAVSALANFIGDQLKKPAQPSLEELIEKQLAEKKQKELAELINNQLNQEADLDDIISEIVGRIIFDELMADEDDSEAQLSLHPSSIEYYAAVFEELFHEVTLERGIDMEYGPEMTELILVSLVGYLQDEMGAELAFATNGSTLVPVLTV